MVPLLGRGRLQVERPEWCQRESSWSRCQGKWDEGRLSEEYSGEGVGGRHGVTEKFLFLF